MYDDAGTLVSGSFVDYLLPTSADTISFDIDHTTSPATTHTLGVKGVGEAGTIASTPAVVNAIVDARSDIEGPAKYSISFIIMIGLLVVGFIANELVKPVDPKHYVGTDSPVREEAAR